MKANLNLKSWCFKLRKQFLDFLDEKKNKQTNKGNNES